MGSEQIVSLIWHDSLSDFFGHEGYQDKFKLVKLLAVLQGVLIGLSMPSSVQTTSKLVISIKEARKLLGASDKQLSDYQVKELILLLTSMAEKFLQN